MILSLDLKRDSYDTEKYREYNFGVFSNIDLYLLPLFNRITIYILISNYFNIKLIYNSRFKNKAQPAIESIVESMVESIFNPPKH